MSFRALLCLVLLFCAATTRASLAQEIPVKRAETFIPDLMQIHWIRLSPGETVIQFQFLRKHCGANLNPPESQGAFRIWDAHNRQRPPFVVQKTEGVFPTWGPAPCGKAGDTFRLTFAPLPRDVSHINVLEGAGGFAGTWSWYNIRIR